MEETNNNVASEQKNTENSTNNTKIETNVLMGVLAYLGPLVIVSYLVAKDDPFVKFHIKQGLVLLVIQVLAWVLMGSMMWSYWMLFKLVKLALLVFSVLGIVNVVQKKEKELPFVGGLASYFKF